MQTFDIWEGYLCWPMQQFYKAKFRVFAMQSLGGRIARFCKFWWRDQSKILSFSNAKIRGEVCEFLQNLGGGIISAKNLKV